MNVRLSTRPVTSSTRAALVAFLSIGVACADAGDPSDADGSTVSVAAVDAIFANFSGADTPGCAVAVSQDGQTTLTRAYGMASLELDVRNEPETVFEPGSVSKQFTAAATIMLALDGALSLDDDIREYIPEIPDYGEPIRIRDLLNHTSGLRDWGSIAAIEGWPRTTRVHTHTHVLDIARRQKALNYPPGQYYSYTNTGYNLQAVLIERVSGMSFADFSQERVFGPLGMTKTLWRDDFTEVVKNRAVAYRPDGEERWNMLMPFENVHGNGGLLTTVADLLKFTHNLDTGEVGGPEFIEEMHRRGVLDSGQQIAYASGLFVGEYKGIREIQHSGGTAGYRGFLTRFPDHGLAISIMCNAGNANPGRFAHEVADLYLGDALVEPAEVVGIDLSVERLAALAGGFRDPRTNAFVEITVEDGALRIRGLKVTPVSERRFEAGGGASVEFEESAGGSRGAAVLTSPVADPLRLEPVDDFEPTATELASYTGDYTSDEAEVTYTVAVEDGSLAMVNRYGRSRALEPVYRDAFSGPLGTIIFRRDAGGRVTGLSLSQGRVWDLRFERLR